MANVTFPRDTTRDIDNTKVVKPARLYGYYEMHEVTIQTQPAQLLDSSTTWTNRIAYSPELDLFVAAPRKRSLNVMRSVDGVTWLAGNPIYNDTNYTSLLAYGNGKFVAFGTSASISTSTDGINWTALVDSGLRYPSNAYMGAAILVYGNGKFLIMHNAGVFATSTDGLSWSAVTQGPSTTDSGSWRYACYGKGMFIIQGGSSTQGWWQTTTTDCVTWTTPVKIGNTLGYGVTYSPIHDKFFAIFGNGNISESSDGLSWSEPVANSTLVDSGVTSWGSVVGGDNELLYINSSGIISVETKTSVKDILYTDSTTLETGMTLYNNEGIAYEEYKVGEVLTSNSFDLLQIQRLNVEDYNYTSDASYNIVLTEYTGSNTAVIAPELEN